jgi:hypothetical protein
MSDKGRKRRRTAARPAAERRDRAPDAGEPERTEGSAANREGFLQRILRPRGSSASPYPPLGRSVGHAALAVGSSPLVLAVSFFGLLVLWVGFALLQAALSPQGLVYVMGVPPVHLLLDVGVVQSLIRTSTTSTLVALVALGVGRGVILGAVTLLVLGAVRGEMPLRSVVRRLPRVAVAQFGIYGVEVGLFLVVLLFVQSLLGPVAILVLLVVGLLFLGFAPVVAAAERVPAGTALRLGFRAARLPGPRHLTLVLVYLLVVLYAGAGATAAAGANTPTTPSILTWGMALLATFVHAVVLGALAYRWDSVRDQILAAETKREEERRAARGRGRGRRRQPSRTQTSSRPARATTSAKTAAGTEPAPVKKRSASAGRAPRGSRRSQKGRGPRKGRRR